MTRFKIVGEVASFFQKINLYTFSTSRIKQILALFIIASSVYDLYGEQRSHEFKMGNYTARVSTAGTLKVETNGHKLFSMPLVSFHNKKWKRIYPPRSGFTPKITLGSTNDSLKTVTIGYSKTDIVSGFKKTITMTPDEIFIKVSYTPLQTFGITGLVLSLTSKRFAGASYWLGESSNKNNKTLPLAGSNKNKYNILDKNIKKVSFILQDKGSINFESDFRGWTLTDRRLIPWARDFCIFNNYAKWQANKTRNYSVRIKITKSGNEDLIQNAGFECVNDGKPSNWEVKNGSLEVVENGRKGKCIILKNLNGDKKPILIQKQIKLEPGSQYKLSYWIRAISCARPYTDTGYQPFRVLAKWYYKTWRSSKLVLSDTSAWDDVMSNWQKKTLVLKKSPAIKTIFTLSLEVKAPGGVYLDDFKLEKIKNDDNKGFTVDLENPYYRNSFYADDGQDKIKLHIKRENQAIRSFKVVLMSVAKQKKVFEKKIKAEDVLSPVSIPASILAVGAYNLSVTGISSQNKTLAAYEININKLPPHTPEVTVRDDNTLLVDRKPFFPIIFLGVFPTLTADRIAKLSEYGINCLNGHVVFNPEENTRKLLDMAQQSNMKILLSMRPKRGTFEDVKKYFDTVVKPVLDHPALLGYLSSDEPAWSGESQEKLLKLYNYFKKTDPYRPVWINYAPRNSIKCLAEYNKSCDITGVDIYPIPDNKHSGIADKTLTSIGKYTERMRKTVADRKPVWMVLQGFAWGHIPGRRPQTRYPTHKELRFMVYDSIVHGAKGIGLWGTETIRKLDYWGVIFSITKEIKMLSPALITRDVKGEVILNNSSDNINFIHKKTGDGDFIFAVNDSNKSVTADFLTKFKNRKINVCFENREIVLSSGAFSDNFAPYAVHIYTTDKQAQRHPVLVKTPAWVKNIAYWGDASWIRHPYKKQQKGPVIWYFKREFLLDKSSVSKVILQITADAKCQEIYINGKKLDAFGSGWKVMEQYDISKLVVQGKNLLAVKFYRGGGTKNAALLFDIIISQKNGSVEHITSDSKCLSSMMPGKEWYLTGKKMTDSWLKAKVLGKYGIKPWNTIYPYPANHPDIIYFDFR
jgi:hypothetical protein